MKQGAIANLMINFTESVVRTGKLANPTTKDKNTGGEFYQDFVTDKYLGTMKNPINAGTWGLRWQTVFRNPGSMPKAAPTF